jgi:hypothetical protein
MESDRPFGDTEYYGDIPRALPLFQPSDHLSLPNGKKGMIRIAGLRKNTSKGLVQVGDNILNDHLAAGMALNRTTRKRKQTPLFSPAVLQSIGITAFKAKVLGKHREVLLSMERPSLILISIR